MDPRSLLGGCPVILLVIYCNPSSRFCDAKQTGSNRTPCGEGQFNFSPFDKCLPCSFICKRNEKICRRQGCLEHMSASRCKQEECYDVSTGKCIHSFSQGTHCKGTKERLVATKTTTTESGDVANNINGWVMKNHAEQYMVYTPARVACTYAICVVIAATAAIYQSSDGQGRGDNIDPFI